MFVLIQIRHWFLNLKNHCLKLYICFIISVRVQSEKQNPLCVCVVFIVYTYTVILYLWLHTDRYGKGNTCGRQSGKADECKVGETKNRLELKSMSWSPWGWTETHVNSHCLWPWRPGCPVQAGALCRGTKHTPQAQELQRLKENLGGGGAVTLPHTLRWGNRYMTTCVSYKMLLHFYLPHHTRPSPVATQLETYREGNSGDVVQLSQPVTLQSHWSASHSHL